MNLKIVPIFSVLIALFAYTVNTYADMTVRLENETNNYAIYVNKFQLLPGAFKEMTLKNAGSLSLTMDKAWHPTPLQTYGLGVGCLVYGSDPKSGNSFFTIMFDPLEGAPPSTPAPTFTFSGGVAGHFKDSWGSIASQILYGSNNKTLIKVTE